MVQQKDRNVVERLMSAIPRSPIARKILEQDAKNQAATRAELIAKKAELQDQLETQAPVLLKSEAAARAKYEAAMKAADTAKDAWAAASRERISVTSSLSHQISRIDSELTATAGEEVDELIWAIITAEEKERQAPFDGVTYEERIGRLTALRAARVEANELKTRSSADIAAGVARIREQVLN